MTIGIMNICKNFMGSISKVTKTTLLGMLLAVDIFKEGRKYYQEVGTD